MTVSGMFFAPGRRAALLALLSIPASSGLAWAEERLDLEAWLARPGARLVAVELFASWCAPCLEAAPRWRALHEAYRDRGLRLVVVSTRDPACSAPEGAPDAVVCDPEGRIAERLGASELPAAFLWSWRGEKLAAHASVDDVTRAVEAWTRAAPRVEVRASEIPPSAGISQEGLRDAVRIELLRLDKLVLVASTHEKRSLRELVRGSLELGSDEALACEVGQELSANSLLRASITAGATPLLHLQLFSAERGCLVGAGAARWRPQRPVASVGEAAADLLDALRAAVRPTPAAGSPAPAPTIALAGQRGGFDGETPGAVLLAAGGASAVASGVAFLLAQDRLAAAERATQASALEAGLGEHDTFQTLGFALGSAAVGLAVLGAVMLAFDEDGGPSPTASFVERGAWAGLGGRW